MRSKRLFGILVTAVSALILVTAASPARATRFCGHPYNFTVVCLRSGGGEETYNCSIPGGPEDEVCVPDIQQFNLNNLALCDSCYGCDCFILYNAGYSFVTNCSQCP